MLNKILAFLRRYHMIQPGDKVICAVSGGADSIALLLAMYLLSEKLNITLEAAHFNHHLRGEESDRDEAFVKSFCEGYGIKLHCGSGEVKAGKKGLEAAARDARYNFLLALPGKIATAHTAGDNAETLLMHLIRGTGLKGLGGIAPVSGNLIRPMLEVTRQEVNAFLKEYGVSYVDDSSNDTDCFLRNRVRHHIMPLLQQENPKICENLSSMAQRLREDEAALSELVDVNDISVAKLRNMPYSLRSRNLAAFLEKHGVKEPSAEHIALLDNLVFSQKPSGKGCFPNGVIISRCYDKLVPITEELDIPSTELACPGETVVPDLCLKVICKPATELLDKADRFTVSPSGKLWLRSRAAGDAIRRSGGTKTLKKLFIDCKIPAAERSRIPVIADDNGVVGVYGIGGNSERLAPEIEISFEQISEGNLQ